jgi:hypothetical protein
MNAGIAKQKIIEVLGGEQELYTSDIGLCSGCGKYELKNKLATILKDRNRE